MKIFIFITLKIFFYYINNEKQLHDAYKNKSSKNKNKTKFKNDVNVELIIVFLLYYNQQNEREINIS